MIIIGGKALGRNSGDTDFWVPEGTKIELYSFHDYSVIPSEIMGAFSSKSKELGVATLEDMMAIKMSHMPWDIQWWKHAQDVLWMQSKGIIANHHLYQKLIQYWEVEHGTKTNLSLYKTKDEFFNDAVVKHFEHDYLHQLVAVNGFPVYTRCLMDDQEVMIDQDKFFRLSLHDQVRMFKEEIAVIALERWIIPAIVGKKGLTGSCNQITIERAWQKALHKTVVNLTKGWASRFIIENLLEFTKPLSHDMLTVLDTLDMKESYMENKMTLKELVELIKSNFPIEDVDGWFLDNRRSSDTEITDEEIIEEFVEYLSTSEILLEASWVVSQVGGGEGGSGYCESVLLLGDTYYKVVYAYYSYHGFDFDGAEVSVVKPVEKTVIVYE